MSFSEINKVWSDLDDYDHLLHRLNELTLKELTDDTETSSTYKDHLTDTGS